MLPSSLDHYQSDMPRHIFIFAGSIITAILIHLYILLSEGFVYVEIKHTSLLIAIALMILLSYCMAFISFQLDKLLPWSTYPLRRIGIGIAVHSTMVFSAFYLFYSLLWNTHIFESPNTSSFNDVTIIKLGIVILVMAFLYYIIKYATISYHYYAYTQIQQRQLQREIVDAQFDILKSQLQPHFLFNSLNTISSLLHKDDQLAESFIRKLAKSYDYTLSNYNNQWVSLSQELEFVGSFVEMMKIRFGDHLQLKVKMIEENSLLRKIMPLSLQLLVENAIKHNVIDAHQLLSINIFVGDQFIEVSNNKTMTPTFIKSHKIGLKNLKKRYGLWTSDPIIISDSSSAFTVKIPLN